MAYANDQWSMAGGQLLTVRYHPAKRFSHDPSEMVTDVQCPREYWRPIARAITLFPRDAFDYLWVIRPPAYDPKFNQGLIPVWTNGPSTLYKIDHGVQPAEVGKGDLPFPNWERQLSPTSSSRLPAYSAVHVGDAQG